MNVIKQDAGGLPELPKPGHYDDYEGEWYWTGSQMRAYGELCRAAPAGGDPTPLEEMAGNARDLGLNYGPRSCPFCGYSMTEFPGLDSEHIGQWIFQNEREEFGLICGACEAEGPAASTKAGAIQTWNERHDATVFGHSAPAGSGEVSYRWLDDLRDRMDHCISAADEGEDYAVPRDYLDAMTTLGLMKKVGRGKWAPTEEGEAFAQRKPTLPVNIYRKTYEVPIPVQLHIVALEEAAALLRKLQQGADYVMVPREALRTEARRLRYRAGECWPTFSTGTDAGAQMIGTAESLERLASQDQEKQP